VRQVPGLLAFEVVNLYARQSIREVPEVAAQCELVLLHEVGRFHELVRERRPYNPYLELRR
jgi:hypothetical protein